MSRETTGSRINHVCCSVREISWSLPTSTCDLCQRQADRVWETERVAIDLDLDHPVLLLVHVSVHHCLACDHFFRVQPPFLRRNASYTNRVVNKAVVSVYADGMAMIRVANRLARDFWVQPSEATIRLWCASYSRNLSLEGDYQQWVVSEFSGILCVDEVYQGRIALLLAVDPAAPDGDRLVGYQLLSESVEQEQVEQFLMRLRQAGVMPEEIITDRSALYPTVLSKVWPTAVHQLCLFHETRAVTKAVLQVAREVRRALPKPPALRRPHGRISRKQQEEGNGKDSIFEHERQVLVARVQQLRKEGCSMRSISRQTGHARSTVRRWLKEKPLQAGVDAESVVITEVENTVEAITPSDSDSQHLTGSTALAPSGPWENWDEVGEFGQALLTDQFLLARRLEHLRKAELQRLNKLLGHRGSEKLRLARGFVNEWYTLWRDETGRRRSPEEALARYEAWQGNEGYRTLTPLKRIQAKIDHRRFEQLSQFLLDPRWEATNNGAERMGRQFRHAQSPHFGLRTGANIEGMIKAEAVRRLALREVEEPQSVGRSTRGRKLRSKDVRHQVQEVVAA